MLVRALRRCGYTIQSARDGREALEIASTPEPIDLLISDVEMPDMSGPALAEMLSTGRPRLKVILMSGFYSSAAADRRDWVFLEKPFAIDTLIAGVDMLCAL